MILGASGVVGRLLIDRLAEDASVERIIAAAVEAPAELPDKAEFIGIDLLNPSAVNVISDAVDSDDIDAVVHMGYLSDRSESQERQADETRHILDALRRRPVPRAVFCSSTTVYGALPGDPTHLSEDTPLVQDAHSQWVLDKVTVEVLLRDFLLDCDATVSVLRFALLLGPTIRNFVTDYLRRTAVPVVAGLDPPVQFLNERDAASAIHHVLGRDCDGPFNIVGDGALPLSVALRIGRRRSAPVPELGSYPLHQALWEPDIVEAPDVLQDLFRYVWVADGSRIAQQTGYSPRHSTKETVEEFYKG